ncbi:MAG: FAD-dependent oxidoreductase [Polyangiaceae bacterium]
MATRSSPHASLRAGARLATRDNYDVAIVGGGPAGCVTALSFAKRGARVLVLEANPAGSRRLAGEWIHPPAVQILKDLGIDLRPERPFHSGRGFVVYPDDGSRPIALPYESGSSAYSFEHSALVDTLRGYCDEHPLVDYVPYARATRLEPNALTYQMDAGSTHTAKAGLLVGAGGRMSVAHTALGIRRSSGTYSRMAGLVLENIEMPFEGYGHVCLGGLGPILMYRIDARHVRLQIDVPLSLRLRRDRHAVLYEAYSHALPESLRPAFRVALARNPIIWATNQIRPRLEFGREGLALVGDAVGYHHPLTAVGMTMGFQDAVCLANAKSFKAYRRERILRSRVPELLAVALYEVFADTSDETVAMRSAVYELWQRSPDERFKTMRFLGCQNTNPAAFGSSFFKAMLIASQTLVRRGATTGRWDQVRLVTSELAERSRWLLGGALHLTPPHPTQQPPGSAESGSAEERFGAALRASSAKADVVELPSAASARLPDKSVVTQALERGVRAFVAQQAEDGSWEGEVAWCPMLAAQYVIACHLMGRPISAERRKRFILHFDRTRLASGTWGLHETSQPYLFTTTLVYVAARLLGLEKDDPILRDGLRFIRDEGGATAIPSWGKFWLALANLYEWDGVSPVLPEIWRLPKWFPLHPSNYYCHTRLIYLAMSALSGQRYQGPRTALIERLREELYPQGYASVDFKRARTSLRADDLFTPWSKPLDLAYRALGVADRIIRFRPSILGSGGREAEIAKLRDRIRYELRTTNHTSISPVSGILNVLALHVSNARDPDAQKAFETIDGWIWEDDVDGARIAGARSASWDTGFAMQALAEVAPHVDVRRPLEKATHYLEAHQIRETFPDARAYDRVDPKGGYCFAGVWHGWPVSDCTAEALLGRIHSAELARSEASLKADVEMGVRFILQEQNRDGGFSTYEPRRVAFSLEWINPAEMFGDSMTEFSFVECTASCVAALVKARPYLAEPELVDAPVRRAIEYIRGTQHPNGSWPGAWGVRLIYGTMFGIRGLVAAGAPPTDPSLRKACAWLRARQRPDGSWGEAPGLCPGTIGGSSSPVDVYAEEAEGQVVQTAWALSALLEAEDPDWDVIERAARFLANAQLGSGEWPKQAPTGVFFHTALLDYALYRAYFPLWALGQYETRRKRRALLLETREPEAAE